MGRFEQRFRVEHQLRISLCIENRAGQRSYAAGGGRQRMDDHFIGADHKVHAQREQVGVGSHNRGESWA